MPVPSSVFHLFFVIGEEWYESLARLDYIGINVLIGTCMTCVRCLSEDGALTTHLHRLTTALLLDRGVEVVVVTVLRVRVPPRRLRGSDDVLRLLLLDVVGDGALGVRRDRHRRWHRRQHAQVLQVRHRV